MNIMDYLAEPANRSRIVRAIERWTVPVVLSVVALLIAVIVLQHQGIL